MIRRATSTYYLPEFSGQPVPNEDWMTILFDPVTAKAMNPNFDPTAVLYLGAIFVSGAQGETTPVPMTFLLASDETS